MVKQTGYKDIKIDIDIKIDSVICDQICMSLQTLYCNASCECIPVQCSLLTDNYKQIITELHVPCVRSTGSTLITLVHIGYAMRSKYARAQCSYYNTGVK